MKLFLKFIFLLVTISSVAQTTFVPDDRFEQVLIDLGYDDILDNSVITNNINTVKKLDVANKEIINLTGIQDFTDLEILICNGNNLTTLNLENHIKLKELYCTDNFLENLVLENNIQLQKLVCSRNKIEQLTIDKNVELFFLDCRSNLITELNVTHNLKLKELIFRDNSIGEIDVTRLLELEKLICNNNQLKIINLSLNTALIALDCRVNLLESIDVKNGNNANMVTFLANNNPTLSCISVDNEIFSKQNWTAVDVGSIFSENCELVFTSIPDQKFEQALIDLGYDDVLDQQVLTTKISTIQTLDISGKGIENLSGLENFSSLRILFCNRNILSSLDVSHSKNLSELVCSRNRLTELDVSKNLKLTYLDCRINLLEELNMNENKELTYLDARVNRITSLETNQNANLTDIIVSENLLKKLNLSNNSVLEHLDVSNNQLKELNLKNSGNEQLTFINVNSNGDLKCIEVDNVTYSEDNWRNTIPLSKNFSEDCDYVKEVTKKDYTILPNPVIDVLQIVTNEPILLIEVYDAFGRKIIRTQNFEVDFSNHHSGIYFLQLFFRGHSFTEKIVKVDQ